MAKELILEKSVTVMMSEPSPGVSIEDARKKYSIIKDENDLSAIYAVVENKANLGLAYDGDADRCIAIDENGNIIYG